MYIYQDSLPVHRC